MAEGIRETFDNRSTERSLRLSAPRSGGSGRGPPRALKAVSFAPDSMPCAINRQASGGHNGRQFCREWRGARAAKLGADALAGAGYLEKTSLRDSAGPILPTPPATPALNLRSAQFPAPESTTRHRARSFASSSASNFSKVKRLSVLVASAISLE